MLVAALLLPPAAAPLAAQQRMPVRAVLFYSPTCPHCHRVIDDVLPGVFARFGGAPRFVGGEVAHVWTNGRLELLLVDASQRPGYQLYDAAARALRLPDERTGGVPLLFCGDSALAGADEIPAVFPDLIARAEAAGGLPWPAWPGLRELLPPGYTPPAPRPAAPPETTAPALPVTTAAAPSDTTVAAAPQLPAPPRTSPFRRVLEADPVGTVLALALLALMLASIGWVTWRAPDVRGGAVAVPVLIGIGLLVAGYLAWIETSGQEAVCGPVGDCNAVQHSPYARVLGIPVAVIGLAGYAAILVAWLIARSAGAWRDHAARAAYIMALAGTTAAAVLTFLEPFVIGAVCAWCLTSALVMTALLWLLAGEWSTRSRAAPRPASPGRPR